MPRNKYPEVTEKAILDTAKRLFLEHGYEHVTLQDIAEACGLTRGAIYHHFHGKEEMLDAVTTYMFHETVPCREIQEDTSRNGLEKLQRLIIASVSNREQLQMYRMLSRTFYQSPKLVCAYLLSCRTSVVPMTRTFLEEGVSDGSITVDSPQIAAEVVAVFTNLLLSPLVFSSTGPDFQRKVACVSTMLESIGLPLINDQVSAAFSAMGAVLYGEELTYVHQMPPGSFDFANIHTIRTNV